MSDDGDRDNGKQPEISACLARTSPPPWKRLRRHPHHRRRRRQQQQQQHPLGGVVDPRRGRVTGETIFRGQDEWFLPKFRRLRHCRNGSERAGIKLFHFFLPTEIFGAGNEKFPPALARSLARVSEAVSHGQRGRSGEGSESQGEGRVKRPSAEWRKQYERLARTQRPSPPLSSSARRAAWRFPPPSPPGKWGFFWGDKRNPSRH